MNINKMKSLALLLFGVCLLAACSAGNTPPATTTTSATNATVTANPGSDQSVFVGALVALNGSGSTTTNSSPLSYTWTMRTRPAGSVATLSSTNVVNPTFTADLAGTYECDLIVSDGQQTSPPAPITVTAAGTNPRPAANAGLARSVFASKPVALDGSKSSDANGDPLTYRWTITGRPAQSQAFLFDANTVIATFTPDLAGLYAIQLVVNDGMSDSTPSSVNITASAEPPPTANAGLDQIVLPNTQVFLSGSLSSDPGGDTLSYTWSLTPPPGVSASLSNTSIVNPNFTPSVVGAYTAQLIVTDSTGATSAPDTVLIIVGPRADAGPAQTVSVGSTVQLSGSGSFGASLNYSWAFIAPLVPGSTAAFSPNNTVVNPTFVANVAGTYMIRLTVTDSVGRSASATTAITARTGPVANFISSPSNPGIGTTISLTNTSTGASLSYSWSFVSRPTGSTAAMTPNSTSTNPTFIADKAGNYIVRLTATDTGTSATNAIQKTIVANNPPSAIVGISPASANIFVCRPVNLDGSQSQDSDGFPSTAVASYAWSLTNRPSGSAAFIVNPAAAITTITPDKSGSYAVSLVVTDGLGLQSIPTPGSFTASINTTGQTYYSTANSFPPLSACSSCHSAGGFDTTASSGAPDLSLAIYNANLIVSTLQSGSTHSGGTTTLAVATLAQRAGDLRTFLDSTPCLP